MTICILSFACCKWALHAFVRAGPSPTPLVTASSMGQNLERRAQADAGVSDPASRSIGARYPALRSTLFAAGTDGIALDMRRRPRWGASAPGEPVPDIIRVAMEPGQHRRAPLWTLRAPAWSRAVAGSNRPLPEGLVPTPAPSRSNG